MGEISKEVEINNVIVERFRSAGIDPYKKPYELLARLSVAKKMTLDKYGEEHYEEDNAAQLKVAEIMLKMTQQIDDRVEEVKGATLTHRMAPEDIMRLEKIAAELKGLEARLVNDKVQQGAIDAEFVAK